MKPAFRNHSLALNHQQGVAALLVTVMIVMIASAGAVYAYRQSHLTQKAAVHNANNAAALQAAEAGMDLFIQRTYADMAELATNPSSTTTQILVNDSGGSGGPTSCTLGTGTMVLPYQIHANFRDGSNPKIFAAGRFRQNTLSGLNTSIADDNSAIAPDAGYRVRAELTSSGMNITSEGCVGNTGTSTAASGDICANDSATRAVIRRAIRMNGRILPTNNALNIRNHMDANSTFNLSTAHGSPNPECGILFGAGGNPGVCDMNASGRNDKGCLSINVTDNSTGKQVGKLDASVAAMSRDDFFKAFAGGLSKAEIKAMSDTYSGCPVTPPTSDFVWIDVAPGSSLSSCTMPQGKFIVINGNVGGTIAAQGGSFVYVTGNVLQDGALNIQGAGSVEGVWDVVPNVCTGPGCSQASNPGAYHEWPAGVWHGPNGMADAVGANAATLSGRGSLTINYMRKTFGGGTTAVQSQAGRWIDF